MFYSLLVATSSPQYSSPVTVPRSPRTCNHQQPSNKTNMQSSPTPRAVISAPPQNYMHHSDQQRGPPPVTCVVSITLTSFFPIIVSSTPTMHRVTSTTTTINCDAQQDDLQRSTDSQTKTWKTVNLSHCQQHGRNHEGMRQPQKGNLLQRHVHRWRRDREG